MTNKDEILRWATNEDGTEVWYKFVNTDHWYVTTTPNWLQRDTLFVVNDEWVDIRKAFIDGAIIETQIDYMSDSSMSYGESVMWNTKYNPHEFFKRNIDLKYMRIKDEYRLFKQALEEGKVVEYKDGMGDWQDINHTCILINEVDVCDLRIEPEYEWQWTWYDHISGRHKFAQKFMTEYQAQHAQTDYKKFRKSKRIRNGNE